MLNPAIPQFGAPLSTQTIFHIAHGQRAQYSGNTGCESYSSEPVLQVSLIQDVLHLHTYSVCMKAISGTHVETLQTRLKSLKSAGQPVCRGCPSQTVRITTFSLVRLPCGKGHAEGSGCMEAISLGFLFIFLSNATGRHCSDQAPDAIMMEN